MSDTRSPKLVGLFLDRLELPRALAPREPYVVAVCASGAEPTGGEVEVRTAPGRGVSRRKALDYKPPVVLLAPGAHGDFIAARIVVMESDGRGRDAAARIDGARHLLRDTGLGRALAAGAALAGIGAAAASVEEAAGVVANLLRANGDDVLLELTAQVDLKGRGEFPVPFEFGNDRCVLHLRLAASADQVPAVEEAPAEEKAAAGAPRRRRRKAAKEAPPAETGTAPAAAQAEAPAEPAAE